MQFQVGDWVEALQDDRCGRGCRIVRGKLYQVEAVTPNAHRFWMCTCKDPNSEADGVSLVGQPMRDDRMWCGSSFRLVYRRRSELTAGLLASSFRDAGGDAGAPACQFASRSPRRRARPRD